MSRNYMEVLDKNNREEMRKKGMTIIDKSQIDMAAFKKASEKAYEKLNLVTVRDKIYKELGKKK